MKELEKTAFPREIREPDSPIWLQAFAPKFARELWEWIESDRQLEERGDIWPGMHTLEAMTNYVSLCDADNPDSPEFAYLIRDRNNALVGTFHVHSISWWNERTEIGYGVDHFAEGKGYASAALRLIEKVLEKIGFRRIEIRCNPTNRPSCAVAERNGYIKEGVLRLDTRDGDTFRDSVVYSKLLQNPLA